jgi:hypothetical protein
MGAQAQIRPELVDEMIDLYCDWRTASAEVQAAYDRFCDASHSDRVLAFAAYTAALDREQIACDSYAAQIRVIEARCTEPGAIVRLRDDVWSEPRTADWSFSRFW